MTAKRKTCWAKTLQIDSVACQMSIHLASRPLDCRSSTVRPRYKVSSDEDASDNSRCSSFGSKLIQKNYVTYGISQAYISLKNLLFFSSEMSQQLAAIMINLGPHGLPVATSLLWTISMTDRSIGSLENGMHLIYNRGWRIHMVTWCDLWTRIFKTTYQLNI